MVQPACREIAIIDNSYIIVIIHIVKDNVCSAKKQSKKENRILEKGKNPWRVCIISDREAEGHRGMGRGIAYGDRTHWVISGSLISVTDPVGGHVIIFNNWQPTPLPPPSTERGKSAVRGGGKDGLFCKLKEE